MSKTVVFGSINMDLVISVTNFSQPGETIIGKQHQWFPGGKGANQAVAIRRLGGAVSMVGKIGDDYLGQTAVNVLHSEHVATDYLKTVPGVATGLAVIQVDAKGENTIVVSPGANAVWPETAAEIDRILEDCDLVLLQLEIPVPVVGKILTQAKKRGLYTILNAAPACQAIIPYLPQVDLLIVNETEAALLSGEAQIDSTNIGQAITRLTKLGASEVIVTLGEQGCLVYTQGQYHSLAAYQVTAVDSTAAGDVFVGAVVTGLSRKASLLEAARWASAAGALTVTKLGAQVSIPTQGEVERFREAIDSPVGE